MGELEKLEKPSETVVSFITELFKYKGKPLESVVISDYYFLGTFLAIKFLSYLFTLRHCVAAVNGKSIS